jgi:hypothetical protein
MSFFSDRYIVLDASSVGLIFLSCVCFLYTRCTRVYVGLGQGFKKRNNVFVFAYSLYSGIVGSRTRNKKRSNVFFSDRYIVLDDSSVGLIFMSCVCF